jgi:hypothetical protein
MLGKHVNGKGLRNMLIENVQKMNLALENSIGMDIVIISTNNKQLEEYCQKILPHKNIVKKGALIIVIYEDWKNGAGNGLGTLYSYLKANEKAKKLYNIDLFAKQREGAAIAIYHTAGQGKRLYPITASEYGNKSIVKLPCEKGGQTGSCMTILEGVIKQTAIFALTRKGRLSVFWGDQIFIPAKSCENPPTSHIELLVKSTTLPINKESWENKRLSEYGVGCFNSVGEVVVLDKINFETFHELIISKKIELKDGLKISLGSFNLSIDMTFALLEEFKTELNNKSGTMDSDPFFWMPTTLDLKTYVELLENKKVPSKLVAAHFERMQKFKKIFSQKYPELAFFGFQNIGKHSYWWDYGTIQNYFHNIQKLTRVNYESDAMRMFFMDYTNENLSLEYPIDQDTASCLINCQIKSGRIKNSVLVGVIADHIDVENCFIIDSKLKSLQAKNCLLYNVVDNTELILAPETVRADIFLPENKKHLTLLSNLNRDGKDDWDVKIPSNPYTYSEVEDMSSSIDLYSAFELTNKTKTHLFSNPSQDLE